jgi:hypothetical protein
MKFCSEFNKLVSCFIFETLLWIGFFINRSLKIFFANIFWKIGVVFWNWLNGAISQFFIAD